MRHKWIVTTPAVEPKCMLLLLFIALSGRSRQFLEQNEREAVKKDTILLQLLKWMRAPRCVVIIACNSYVVRTVRWGSN